jgi:thymidylate synthase (FAD)
VLVELLSITPDAEELIEEIGRTAYLSWDKKSKGSTERFIRMLVKKGHTSVLEHAKATFRIRGGSRAFTHQLVRHRLCAFTQQSQRYVNESNFNYITPKSIENNEAANQIFKAFVHQCRHLYKTLQSLGIKNEDARFVLPNAIESVIVITTNFRQWRHIINLRGSKHAQWEIRNVTIAILQMLKSNAPTCFEDFIINEEEKVVRRIMK